MEDEDDVADDDDFQAPPAASAADVASPVCIDLTLSDDDDAQREPTVSRKRARLLPPVSSAAAAAAAAEGQETTTVSSIEAEIGRIDNELDDLDAQAQVIEYERMSLRSRREQLRAKLSDASAKQLALKMRKEWGDDSLFNWSADVEAAKTKLLGGEAHPFRHNQRDAINATLDGRDAMVIMPTGGGKTLCYLVPAVVGGGLTLIISPLLALIHDQVQQHRAAGLDATAFNGDTSKERAREILNAVADPEATLQLLYVTPEKFVKSKSLLNKLEKAHEQHRLKRIVIDEVHCCSEWGHDFRPDYQKLNMIKIQFKAVPLMVMTATATFAVQTDVKKTLGIQGCEMFTSSTFRKNLAYAVRQKPSAAAEVIDEIADWIKATHNRQSGIVYCLSQKETQDVARGLRDRGINAQAYHAGFETQDRIRVQTSWQENKVDVIVATVAFGLGVNKLATRFVVHHSISKSIEGLYQESGRAGRDGKPADCVVWYSAVDAMRQSSMVCYDHHGINNLLPLLRYCENVAGCRKNALAARFNETVSREQCGKCCDVCRGIRSNEVDMTEHVKALLQICDKLAAQQVTKTLNAYVDLWRGAGRKRLDMDGIGKIPKTFSKADCEHAIVQLLCDGVLAQTYKNTAYSTNVYLVKGRRASHVVNGTLDIKISFARGDDSDSDDGDDTLD